MSNIKRPELIHRSPFQKTEDFFKDIIETGGWPEDYKYVSFYHSADWDGRVCVFGNQYLQTGWWSTIATRDEFCWWLISKDFKKKKMRLVSLSAGELNRYIDKVVSS